MEPHFNGPDYDPALDHRRLTHQIKRVFDASYGLKWKTLSELQSLTDDPQASISAQLRHLRKPRFGGWNVQRQRRGTTGTWEYRVLAPNGERHV